MTPVLAHVLLLLASLQLVSASQWSVEYGALPVVVNSDQKIAPEKLKVNGSFVDSSDGNALPGNAILLCKTPEGPCSPEPAGTPERVQTLYLRRKGELRAGTYSGQLIVQSETEQSEAKSLTVYVSSLEHRWGGVFVVFLGGFLAWWVKVFASNRVTRNQALLPIALHFERLRALDAALNKAQAQVAGSPLLNLRRAVARLMKRLDLNSLEAEFGLPQKSPSPFTTASTISSNFTGFLTETDAAITLLDIFIGEGVEQVLGLAAAGRITSPKVAETVNAIDALFDPQLQPEDARRLIKEEIAKAVAASSEAAALPSGDAVGAPAPPPPLNRLQVEIRSLNLTAWVVLLVVTALGTIMMIVMKPGFGRLTDYLLCLTTNFGIPMLGSIVLPSQTAAAAVTTSTSSQAVSGSKGLAGM